MTGLPARRRSRGQPGRPGTAGSAVLWTVWLMSAICLAAVLGLMLGQAAAAHQRTGAAADLAALAAADRALEGRASACQAAATVAEANHVRLESCVVAGLLVDVVVSAPLGGQFAGLPPARARARAGPADGFRDDTAMPARARDSLPPHRLGNAPDHGIPAREAMAATTAGPRSFPHPVACRDHGAVVPLAGLARRSCNAAVDGPKHGIGPVSAIYSLFITETTPKRISAARWPR
jgi:secretion/DNA translocation related TadE-like protein